MTNATDSATPPPAPPRTVSRSRPARNGRISWVVVALTSLAIVGYVIATYAQGSLATLAQNEAGLATAYADRAAPVRAAFYAHIIFSALALGIGPVQFAGTVRRRRPRLHRWVGRVFLISVAIGSVSSLIMACFNTAAINGFFGFGSLAVLWGWTAWRGWRAIRAGDHLSHQAWMIRCFALTYAGVTLRLWLGILIGVQLPFAGPTVDAERVFDTAYAVLPFLCWLPNIVVAELLLRRRGLPSLALTPSRTASSGTDRRPPGVSAR
ncbi:hypothetical protein BWI15_15015 [Kribbella sp. ALI-6-A]|uniref:DUF2306 domain-containing protein n=1 Tax=Kribbella sp. ALI-6-A TaxID=1933817 RepID=UPI00097BC0E7|nr:DUF2306 domain-containing protein [Kribbella sp. ALI-6-A]ONI71489.1 hypothetical protein BWI15_15015 [Kribbella sp. ALI-6-A]